MEKRFALKMSFLLGMALIVLCASGAMAGEEWFSEQFLKDGEEPVLTKNSYRSDSVAISIHTMRVDKSDVYVADIRVRSVENLQRAFGGGTWGKKLELIGDMSEDHQAILSLTGDSGDKFSSGWVIGNGAVFRDTRNIKRDLCILYRNGEMITFAGADIDHKQVSSSTDDIWQTFLFGPALLDGSGKAIGKFRSNVSPANPRSVIGYYEPGHYCFVQVDGRNTKSAVQSGERNKGMTLEQLAALMESLGCRTAYNLDGGRSAAMWFSGSVISTQATTRRKLGDIVLITDKP